MTKETIEAEERVDNLEEVEIVVLLDEEGNEVEFEVLGYIVLDEGEYMVLCSLESEEEESVLIYRYEETDEDDTLNLFGIEDEEEFKRVVEVLELISQEPSDEE